MEFDVEKNEVSESNKSNYSKSDFDQVIEFSKQMKKEFGDFVRAVVLFGSSAKKKNSTKSDIDVLVVVDDLSIEMTAEIVESYRLITEKIISKVSDKLHITSLKYVTFWQYVRDAHPVAVNVLREGVPIVDSGIIAPMQQLLKRGEIKPSFESIFSYFARSSNALAGAKQSILNATLDLYWSVVDASQALLMMYNVVPPSPEHVAELIESELVPKGVLKPKHVSQMREFYELSRLITHNEMKYLSGKDYDEYHKKAYDYVADIKDEIEKASEKQLHQDFIQ